MLSSIKEKRKEEIVMLHEPHPTMNYFSFKSFMFAKCKTMNKKCLWFEDGTRSFILNHIIGNMVLDLKKHRMQKLHFFTDDIDTKTSNIKPSSCYNCII